MLYLRQYGGRAQVVFLLASVFIAILSKNPFVLSLTNPQSRSSIRRQDSTKIISKSACRGSLFSRVYLSKRTAHCDHQAKRCRRVESLRLHADSKPDNDSKDFADEKSQNTERPTGINALKSGLERIVKTTGLVEEDYQFGDITRSAVSNVTKAAVNVEENIVRSITGDEEYKFGDLTKDLVSNSAENNIGLVVALVLNFFLDLPSSRLIQRLMGELLPQKEEDNIDDQKPVTASLQIIAFIGLTLHFVFNLCHSCGVIFAWGYTLWKMQANPFQSSTTWQFFVSAQNSLRIIIGPWLLPLQVGLTFFWSVKYRNIVVKIEQRLSSLRNEERYATMIRFLAFFVSYFLINCIGMALFTSLGCYSVGTMCRFLMK